MDRASNQGAELELIGGELCLDFANTINHGDLQAEEHLNTFADLVAWSCRAGTLSAKTARRLSAESARRPEEGQRVLQRAIELREAIHRIFTAVSAGKRPRAADLELVNVHLAQAMGRTRLVQRGGDFAWDWEQDRESFDQMLWPIVRSAGDLLTSERRSLVRECGGDACGWLFVDSSKNHTRRWCSMSDCGNRAKARRHLARMHASLS